MLQIEDVGPKILYKQMNQEKDFSQLISATVSHEMRNPLNSIVVLTKHIHQQIKKLSDLL